MNLNQFPTIPSNPFAVRDATIEWCHQLANTPADPNWQYLDAVTAEQVDIAYEDYGLQLEMSAIDEIDDFKQSLLEHPLVQTTVVSDKEKRTERIGCQRAHAEKKNKNKDHDHRVCPLSEPEIVKLDQGHCLHPERGIHLTRHEQTILHDNKVKATKFKQERQQQLAVA